MDLGNTDMSAKPADTRLDHRKTRPHVAVVVAILVNVFLCENSILNRKSRQKPSKSEWLLIRLGGTLFYGRSDFGSSLVPKSVTKSVQPPDVGVGKRTPKSKKNPGSFGTTGFSTKKHTAVDSLGIASLSPFCYHRLFVEKY